MVGRRRPSGAFRTDRAPHRAVGSASKAQTVAMVAVVAAVGAAAGIASYAVRPSKARAFDLYYGTTIINSDTASAPVVVDLASGKPTVRLTDALARVQAAASADLDVVPLSGGSLLLDTRTGEFNMVDSTGFVVKASGTGVQLPALSGSAGAQGVADGSAAYILQNAPGQTKVYLVSQATVASTVASTADTSTPPTPRAHASITDTIGTDSGSTDPGSAVAANGDLWLLTGQPGTPTRTVRQLHVPTGSNSGVQLAETDHGGVNSVSALAVSPTGSNGSGQDEIAVATPTQLRIFDPSGAGHSVPLSVPAGTTQILAAGNQEATGGATAGTTAGFDFLYQSSGGSWTLVTTTPTGATAVHPVTGIPAGAPLAVPARSEGGVYTMTKAGPGALWRIDSSGRAAPVAGMATYPIAGVESPLLDDATVTAYGSRIIFNSRQHSEAVTVFADGSHAPVTIDKSAAVDLNSAGGIEALAATHTTGPTTPHAPKPQPETQPKPVEQVNDKIDCKTASQLPHVPVVQLVQRASRSVQLSWQYPLLSPQDCLPSTYTVQVNRISSSGPQAPGTVTVQGQNGINLVGLFPNTKYSIVITAYINNTGTASQPLQVATGPEGPPAPTGVFATTDGTGNWTLTWNSCGGLNADCVPTASWRIIPSFCDGLGLTTPPASVTVAGDPTLHTFSYTLPGDPTLLGRGLSFQVEGIGQTGLAGQSSSTGGCVTSWARPIAGDITVNASSPPNTSTQGTSSTTVSVTFTGDRNVALGGIGGQLTYTLLQGGNTVDTRGPTNATTVTFGGLHPGLPYQAQVTAIPPGHPEASVTLPAVNVQPAVSDWPTLTLNVAPFSRTDPNGQDSKGTLSVSVSGLASSDAGGETFDLVNSTLTCGNTSKSLSQSNFDPSAGALTFKVDRTSLNGNCTVAIQLTQDSATQTSPAYFGAANSAIVTGNVAIPVPGLHLDPSGSDFSATWSGTTGSSAVTVTYDGVNPLVNTSFATNWSMGVTNDPSSPFKCGRTNDNPPPTPISVAKSCIGTSNNNFTVAISFMYFGAPESYSITVDPKNEPQPLGLQASDFQAAWVTTLDSNGNAAVTLTYAQQPPQDLSSAAPWTEQVSSPSTTDCGDGTFTPSSSGTDITVSASCLSPVPVSGWTIVITYVDPNTAQTETVTVDIPGSPPASLPPPPSPSPSSS